MLSCSDGLWHYFTPRELGAIVHALPPREATEMLVGKARQRARGSGDNLSLAAGASTRCGSQRTALAAGGTGSGAAGFLRRARSRCRVDALLPCPDSFLPFLRRRRAALGFCRR